MSLEGGAGHDGSIAAMKGTKLKRPDSGTSTVTNAVTVTGLAPSIHNNQATYIEAARIERLLSTFLSL